MLFFCQDKPGFDGLGDIIFTMINSAKFIT